MNEQTQKITAAATSALMLVGMGAAAAVVAVPAQADAAPAAVAEQHVAMASNVVKTAQVTGTFAFT